MSSVSPRTHPVQRISSLVINILRCVIGNRVSQISACFLRRGFLAKERVFLCATWSCSSRTRIRNTHFVAPSADHKHWEFGKSISRFLLSRDETVVFDVEAFRSSRANRRGSRTPL